MHIYVIWVQQISRTHRRFIASYYLGYSLQHYEIPGQPILHRRLKSCHFCLDDRLQLRLQWHNVAH
jgi:hypothetical protein